MPQTFSDGNVVYSVDMMIAYVNLVQPKTERLPLSSFLSWLKQPGWGDAKSKYSALDVVLQPTKHEQEWKRVETADLTFPILLTPGGGIADGMHRLTKAFLRGEETILTITLPQKVLDKCALDTHGDIDKADRLPLWRLMVQFAYLYDTLSKNEDNGSK